MSDNNNDRNKPSQKDLEKKAPKTACKTKEEQEQLLKDLMPLESVSDTLFARSVHRIFTNDSKYADGEVPTEVRKKFLKQLETKIGATPQQIIDNSGMYKRCSSKNCNAYNLSERTVCWSCNGDIFHNLLTHEIKFLEHEISEDLRKGHETHYVVSIEPFSS